MQPSEVLMCTYNLDFLWPLLHYKENRETTCRLCDVKFVGIWGN
jgi:hypothetical protein